MLWGGSAYCPPASYSGGGSAYCPPRPYYVGDDTYPWGRVIGSNGAGINGTSAFNNYMPSSGSYSSASNPSSTSSSNPYSNINIELNPVFKPVFNNNNSPIQTSYSGARSSNAAEIKRNISNMPGIRRT